MLISEIYQAIRRFVVNSVEQNVNVIFANQNAPRPIKPFVTIDVGSFKEIGKQDVREIDDQGVQRVVVHKRFTCRLQAFADELHKAEDILTVIHNKLYTQQAYEVFLSNIAFTKPLAGVTVINEAVSAATENRAYIDLEFFVSQEVNSDVGLIETVEYEINTNI